MRGGGKPIPRLFFGPPIPCYGLQTNRQSVGICKMSCCHLFKIYRKAGIYFLTRHFLYIVEGFFSSLFSFIRNKFSLTKPFLNGKNALVQLNVFYIVVCIISAQKKCNSLHNNFNSKVFLNQRSI